MQWILFSDWSQFVAQKAKSWTETNLDWIEQFKGPLLITMYHHLVQNTSHELSTILEFLQASCFLYSLTFFHRLFGHYLSRTRNAHQSSSPYALPTSFSNCSLTILSTGQLGPSVQVYSSSAFFLIYSGAFRRTVAIAL